VRFNENALESNNIGPVIPVREEKQLQFNSATALFVFMIVEINELNSTRCLCQPTFFLELEMMQMIT